MSDFVLVHGGMHAAARADNPMMVNPGFWALTERDGQGRSVCSRASAIKAFFHDVDTATGVRAAELLKPLSPNIIARPSFLPALPEVPVLSVLTDDDFMVSDLDEYRAHLRKRLRVEPVVLPGGHSPFLAHPAALADVLHHFAAEDSAPAYAERRRL